MQVKTYPDDVHYQSKRGKSVTLAKNSKNRTGSLSREERRAGRASEAGNTTEPRRSSLAKGWFLKKPGKL